MDSINNTNSIDTRNLDMELEIANCEADASGPDANEADASGPDANGTDASGVAVERATPQPAVDLAKLREVREFSLPRFDALPDMGLYLEQTLTVLNGALRSVIAEPITKPMMGNYVKHGVVPAPVKKRYYREHIAYSLVMGVLKGVFTVDQVADLYRIQRDTYPTDIAYNYFCTEFENALHEAFDFTGNALPSVETRRTDQTVLIRSMVLAAANQAFAQAIIKQAKNSRL